MSRQQPIALSTIHDGDAISDFNSVLTQAANALVERIAKFDDEGSGCKVRCAFEVEIMVDPKSLAIIVTSSCGVKGLPQNPSHSVVAVVGVGRKLLIDARAKASDIPGQQLIPVEGRDEE